MLQAACVLYSEVYISEKSLSVKTPGKNFEGYITLELRGTFWFVKKVNTLM